MQIRDLGVNDGTFFENLRIARQEEWKKEEEKRQGYRQNWKKNQGWGTNDDPCGRETGDSPWFGIICSGGWVYQLKLSNNGLGGSLPSSLVNIPYLDTLDLSNNLLVGEAPDFLDNMQSLSWMSLASNHLRGDLPALGNNNTGLQYLYFGGNQFQGTIPQSFLNLQGLQELDLSQNALTGQVPDALANLALTSLWIDTNNFSGQMPLHLCESLILCSAAFNPNLMCASMSCTCGAMQSCNCNNLCQTDSDCAKGLCGSCRGASPYMNGYCQS